MAAPVPTLGAAGWENNPVGKTDSLLGYYFCTDVSQTILYRGNVLSLPSHIQQYGHDEALLRTNVVRDLEDYFGRSFDRATVTATTNIPNAADPSRINLTIHVEVVQDDIVYSVGHLINISNKSVRKIMNLNNTGNTIVAG